MEPVFPCVEGQPEWAIVHVYCIKEGDLVSRHSPFPGLCCVVLVGLIGIEVFKEVSRFLNPGGVSLRLIPVPGALPPPLLWYSVPTSLHCKLVGVGRPWVGPALSEFRAMMPHMASRTSPWSRVYWSAVCSLTQFPMC